MLTIGAFARLGGVSVKTLRHYAAIGLLVPAQVDPTTGYRSYAPEQLFLLNHILVLKDLGLSLAQIGALLEEGVPLDQLHGMLRLKRAELHDQIAAAQELLGRVERRLEQLELRTLPLGAPVDGVEHVLPMAIIGGVLLPGLTVPMQWPPSYGARAFAHAAAGNRQVLIVSLDDTALAPWARGEPGPLPAIGVVANLTEHEPREDGGATVMLDLQQRAVVGTVVQTAPFFLTRCREVVEPDVVVDTRVAALLATVRSQLAAVLLARGVPAEALAFAEQVDAPGRLADIAGTVLGPDFAVQQAIQQLIDPVARLELVGMHLARLLDAGLA